MPGDRFFPSFIRLCCLLTAATPCATGAAAQEPACFPGAVGFGINTKAGLTGQVIRVTCLDSEGEGSLRAAIGTKGPRVVIFEIGGVIDLKRKPIRISEPFLTVAGQTAPSPGITIVRGGLFIKTHDVVVRHLRVRPGDAGQPNRSGWEPDGISTYGENAHNIVIDHCSITWAVDENLSASGARTEGPEATSRRVTFSNCIVAEGLHKASHAKGAHSMGSLIHDFCREIAVIGNLYAHNNGRNPYFKAHTTGVIVNNVIYNPGKAAIQLGYSDAEWKGAKYRPENCRVSIVGNVYVQGVNTPPDLAMIGSHGDAYLEDNLAFDRDGQQVAIVGGNVNILKEKPVWPEGLSPLPAATVLEHVARHAGARPKDRDEIDSRIVRELTERKGRIINSQEEVGGCPQSAPSRRTLDPPAHNIEDWLAKLAAEVE